MQEASFQNPSQSERGLNKPANCACQYWPHPSVLSCRHQTSQEGEHLLNWALKRDCVAKAKARFEEIKLRMLNAEKYQFATACTIHDFFSVYLEMLPHFEKLTEAEGVSALTTPQTPHPVTTRQGSFRNRSNLRPGSFNDPL